MNETLLQYWERIKQYWNKFNKTQKITFIATVFLVVLTVAFVSVKMSQTEYDIAFTDLNPTDAKAIKDYLDGANIPYQISTDGRSIGVAKNEVTNVRIDVTSQGLNKNGSVGYGIFNRNSAFGMTDNEFRVNYLDAVQGEIQQVINSFVSVASSKVMINLPEESVFLQKDPKSNEASASVVVQMKQGYTLDQQKIDTMYDLISKSVKNLPVSNITISDQFGDLLPYSKNNTSVSQLGAIASQMEVKRAFEQDINSKVQRILGGVLGPGKVIPMVVATLNFDKKTSSQKLVTPVNTVDQTGIEISVQKIQKSYTSDGSTTGGVAGTGGTDVPGYPGTTGTGKNSSEEISNTVNYEVNRINNEIESSPFVVNDLTISVGVEPPDVNNPDSLTQETMDAIQKLLTNVVSTSLANSGRTLTAAELTDKVTVFKHALAINNTPTNNNTNWWLYGGIGAAALLLAGTAGYVISRRRRAAAEAAALEELQQQAATSVDIPSIDLESVSNENQMRKQLEALAKKKPEEFVNLLRTWLADE